MTAPAPWTLHFRQRRTLQALQVVPLNGTLECERIESLLNAPGCQVIEGSGPAVTFEKYGRRGTFHHPHRGVKRCGPVQGEAAAPGVLNPGKMRVRERFGLGSGRSPIFPGLRGVEAAA